MNSETELKRKKRLVDVSFLTTFGFCFLLSYWFFGACAAFLTVAVFSIITVPVIYWIKKEKESTVTILGRIVFVVVFIVMAIMICSTGD